MEPTAYANEELAWSTAQALELYLGAEPRPGDADLELVAAAVRGHVGRGVPLLDLLQEAILALGRGDRGTDRAAALEQALERTIAGRERTVTVSERLAARERELGRAEEELLAELGRSPHEWELADRAGLSVTEARAVRRAPRGLAGPGRELRLKLGEDALREAVAALPAEERAVLEARYGIAGEPPRTLAETSRLLSLPRAEILVLEEEALERLAVEREIRALRA